MFGVPYGGRRGAATAGRNQTMYIGIGTVVLIVIIVLIVLALRR
jgi:septal ring-binding cell division protein DamX